MHEQTAERTGFLFEGDLSTVDPSTARITVFEEVRQVNKLIMIASESAAPPAVREALASVFTDLYAEGYPAQRVAREPEDLLADIPYQIAYHERYSDRRYYKGTEFADLVETLAQNRVRRLFAPNRYPHNASQLGPEAIQANVQPLSGANANTAVYFGLLQPGDTIMGLNLSHGGHLSHGSPVNISGKLFKVVSYGVNPQTGRIDYDEVARLAQEHQPRMIISGASAYPWTIDWVRLREICDGLPKRAYLMADISHPAGLVVAGVFPNPVGVADITTFTTHKTLIGPRAAIILTTNESLARRIDRAVFPGLQGGPHMNTIAALGVAFKIALTPEFDELQRTIVKNAQALSEDLVRRGLSIAYGGTDTHLFLVDVRAQPQPSGVPLNGDVAARILDLAGVVANKNTMLGDVSAVFPSAVRFGTPWITQRGLTPTDMPVLGGIIADVFTNIVTYRGFTRDDHAGQGKIPPEVLRRAQEGVAALIARRSVGPSEPTGWPSAYCPAPVDIAGWRRFSLAGRRVRAFLSQAVGGDVWSLGVGEATQVQLFNAAGGQIAPLALLRRASDALGLDHFVAAVEVERYDDVTWWLKALSTGLVLFDPADPWAKIDGPVAVAPLAGELSASEESALQQAIASPPQGPDLSKPYFIGQRALAATANAAGAKPPCVLPAPPVAVASPLQASWPADALPAPEGWPMPRRFADSHRELSALRETAGVIDTSGLGILEISGPDARRFLDLVTTNDVAFLARNAAQLTFLIDPRGETIADALLYRVGDDRYLLTTAPDNSARVSVWLHEALAGRCLIDPEISTRTLSLSVQLRDLRSTAQPQATIVIGVAGPKALAALRALVGSPADRQRIGRLRRFTLQTARLKGIEVIIARTSHTGATHGYELFVPANQATVLWEALVAAGATPVGWDAWRAAGIAAGLPWDGHEIGGPFQINPIDAGYGELVRTHKPFFVGRSALLQQPNPSPRAIARLKVVDGEIDQLHEGDPILDSTGCCIGHLTSVSPLAAEPIGLGLLARAAGKIGTNYSIAAGAAIGQPVGIGETVGLAPRVASVEVLSRFPK